MPIDRNAEVLGSGKPGRIHLAALRHTHPSQYKALMHYGMAAELKKLYHTRAKGIPTILDAFDNPDELFDQIGDQLDCEGIDDEYDPEFPDKIPRECLGEED